MLRLIYPSSHYLPSYIEAYDEYEKAGVTRYFFDDARTMDVLKKYDDYRNERNLKPGRVGCDYFWLVEEEQHRFIGELAIRHRLTEELQRYGGHIGYGVRCTEWNRGYGTLMLSLALEKAAEMGIDRVLVTCDDDNIASARVMEKNGLVLEDRIQNLIDGKIIITRRYWKELQDSTINR